VDDMMRASESAERTSRTRVILGRVLQIAVLSVETDGCLC
jgi:hypothetical protein